MQPGNNSVVYKIIRRYGHMTVDFDDNRTENYKLYILKFVSPNRLKKCIYIHIHTIIK